MSKKIEMIILEPDGIIHKEAFLSKPKTCPYCGGNGFFMVPFLPQMDIKKDCPYCEGYGELIAKVEIDWKPKKQ